MGGGGGECSVMRVVVTVGIVVIGAGEGGAAEVVTSANPDPFAAIFLNSTTVLKNIQND